MASTFLDLYSDFQDEIKAYIEKIDVTELSFMRRLSKGMQIFQLETEYIEAIDILNQQENGSYMLPYEYKRIVKIQIVGDERVQFEVGNFTQLWDSIERSHSGFIEKKDNVEINRRNSGEFTIEYSVFGRKLFFDTRLPAGTQLRVFYIPDLSPISRGSILWNQPDDTVAIPVVYKSWYPMDEVIKDPLTNAITSRLIYMMNSTRMLSPMSDYEDVILNYAIAAHIRSKGSINYQVFEKYFREGIEMAKVNKPELFKNGTADYNYSVWS